MTKRTVWAVSSGSYSDYRVGLLFTTKDLAEETAERLNAGRPGSLGDHYVEEFELLDGPPEHVAIYHREAEIGPSGNIYRELEYVSWGLGPLEGESFYAHFHEGIWLEEPEEVDVPVASRAPDVGQQIAEDAGQELSTGFAPHPTRTTYVKDGGRLVVFGSDKQRVDKVYGERLAKERARLLGL